MRKRYLFYSLLFTAAILDSLVALIDSRVMGAIGDPFTYASSFFVVGMLVCVLLGLFFSTGTKKRTIGSLIDPSFKRLRFVKRKELPYHLLAGFGNAVTTVSFYALYYFFTDPSSVMPFYQVVLLYLLFIEAFSEKNAPTIAEIEASVAVVFGAIMMSMTSGIPDLTALAIVFLIMNPAYAIFTLYQRKLKSMTFGSTPNDAINIRFWNVFFTMLFTLAITLIMSPKSLNFGSIPLDLIISATTMSTISFILFIRALGISSASIAQAVKSVSLVITLLFSLLMGQLTGIESTFALLKFMGVVLVILGIIDISFAEVHSVLFIKLESGQNSLSVMDSIWNIKGVDSVALVSGEYDLIAKIRTRTLGKGYETIITKIEGMGGISSVHWDSVLKEWENV
jgi:DNA-binding Lrp family transcriptional regulator